MAFTSSSRLSAVLHPEAAEAAVIVLTIVWTLVLKRLRPAFDFGETFFSATKRGIPEVADEKGGYLKSLVFGFVPVVTPPALSVLVSVRALAFKVGVSCRLDLRSPSFADGASKVCRALAAPPTPACSFPRWPAVEMFGDAVPFSGCPRVEGDGDRAEDRASAPPLRGCRTVDRIAAPLPMLGLSRTDEDGDGAGATKPPLPGWDDGDVIAPPLPV